MAGQPETQPFRPEQNPRMRVINAAHLDDRIIGRRVRLLITWAGLPAGTEGIIDQIFDRGNHPLVMVAWDLEKKPLPPDYKKFEGQPFNWRTPNGEQGLLRDGFSQEELQYLEFVENKK